jgi:hypothetical protein
MVVAVETRSGRDIGIVSALRNGYSYQLVNL